jgi:hypothetical protein
MEENGIGDSMKSLSITPPNRNKENVPQSGIISFSSDSSNLFDNSGYSIATPSNTFNNDQTNELSELPSQTNESNILNDALMDTVIPEDDQIAKADQFEEMVAEQLQKCKSILDECKSNYRQSFSVQWRFLPGSGQFFQ